MWWLAWTVAASAGPVTWESVADEAIDTWAGTGGEVVDALSSEWEVTKQLLLNCLF